MLRLSPALALSLATAAAAQPAPTYHATLVAASAPPAAIVRDLRWRCAGAECAAPYTATSSDATVCAAVARKLGRLTAFTAGARAFDAVALDRCNQAAR